MVNRVVVIVIVVVVDICMNYVIGKERVLWLWCRLRRRLLLVNEIARVILILSLMGLNFLCQAVEAFRMSVVRHRVQVWFTTVTIIVVNCVVISFL